jgi:hypothetical protein
MTDPKKIKLLQDLVIELEVDYQRMSQSGREIYDELSKVLGLDPVETHNEYFCDIGEKPWH